MKKINKTLKNFNSFGARGGEGVQNLLLVQKPLVTTLLLYVYCFTVCVLLAVLVTLVAGLLAGSQYPEGPATGHLGTGFSCFPCVQKRMLRWFPSLQVATAFFSFGPPDLNFLDP
jgi:hypothetical protein